MAKLAMVIDIEAPILGRYFAFKFVPDYNIYSKGGEASNNCNGKLLTEDHNTNAMHK